MTTKFYIALTKFQLSSGGITTASKMFSSYRYRLLPSDTKEKTSSAALRRVGEVFFIPENRTHRAGEKRAQCTKNVAGSPVASLSALYRTNTKIGQKKPSEGSTGVR